jgi:membrane protease YdiL (CAAX protease family)
MERQLDPQSVEIGILDSEKPFAQPACWRMPAVLLFMTVWPWFWVSFGLFTVKDFRVTMFLYEIICCGLPILLLRGEVFSFLPLAVRKRYIFIACLAANIMFLGLFKQTNGMIIHWPTFGAHIQAIGLEVNPAFWIFSFYFVLLNPLFEEVFWRGVVYREWRARLGPWRANLLSSFFFGAWHWIILQYYFEPLWAIICAITVMIGGVIFAYSYEKTGTMGTAVLLHGLGADLPLVFILHTAIINSAALLPA